MSIPPLPIVACLDVHYRGRGGRAACLLLAGWEARQSLEEQVALIPEVEPYVCGQLFRRELPCLLAVLAKVSTPPSAIVVDGYVWLGGHLGLPGLGAHLYCALGQQFPVVGVAKTRFGTPREGGAAVELLRGTSRRPLFVTAAGADPGQAASWIRSMHGPSRLPWALSRVDRLSRG
ncbi:MAG: endonuclease V [Deltaproteobacteria bacterium]|nr:endonuclease V [Deltaproteobacteria bacterium]